jgi:NADH-ubiquinone oxidoreductase chain 5
MSLIALPFLTGFYSKDLIIECAGSTYIFHGSIAFFFSSLTAFLTAFYSSRLLLLTFFGSPNGSKVNYSNAHEPSFIMSIPLIILALFSIFWGYIFKDLFVGLGTSFWGNSLFTHPNHSLLVEAEFGLPVYIKLLPITGTLLGVFIAILFYIFYPHILNNFFRNDSFSGRSIHRFLTDQWHFDNVQNKVLDRSLNFGYITFKLFDRGVLELIGPNGISQILFKLSTKFTSLDSGYLPHYLLYAVISFIFLVFFILLELDPKIILLFLWTIIFSGPILARNFLHSPPPHIFYF